MLRILLPCLFLSGCSFFPNDENLAPRGYKFVSHMQLDQAQVSLNVPMTAVKNGLINDKELENINSFLKQNLHRNPHIYVGYYVDPKDNASTIIGKNQAEIIKRYIYNFFNNNKYHYKVLELSRITQKNDDNIMIMIVNHSRKWNTSLIKKKSKSMISNSSNQYNLIRMLHNSKDINGTRYLQQPSIGSLVAHSNSIYAPKEKYHVSDSEKK